MHYINPQTIKWLVSDLICGFWEVDDEVEPIAMFTYQTFGSYFYVMLILICYAHRRGLV